jgi:hypothetical protein
MNLMLVAARAVLLPLDALRMEPLVLRGEVVPILTLAAGENDLVSWHCNYRVEGSRPRVEDSSQVRTRRSGAPKRATREVLF